MICSLSCQQFRPEQKKIYGILLSLHPFKSVSVNGHVVLDVFPARIEGEIQPGPEGTHAHTHTRTWSSQWGYHPEMWCVEACVLLLMVTCKALCAAFLMYGKCYINTILICFDSRYEAPLASSKANLIKVRCGLLWMKFKTKENVRSHILWFKFS